MTNYYFGHVTESSSIYSNRTVFCVTLIEHSDIEVKVKVMGLEHSDTFK